MSATISAGPPAGQHSLSVPTHASVLSRQLKRTNQVRSRSFPHQGHSRLRTFSYLPRGSGGKRMLGRAPSLQVHEGSSGRDAEASVRCCAVHMEEKPALARCHLPAVPMHPARPSLASVSLEHGLLFERQLCSQAMSMQFHEEWTPENCFLKSDHMDPMDPRPLDPIFQFITNTFKKKKKRRRVKCAHSELVLATYLLHNPL